MAIRLALGAVVAALAVPRLGAAAVGLVAASFTLAVLAVRLTHRQARHRGLGRSAALGVGALAVALRCLAVPTTVPPIAIGMVGDGPWEATVVSISALHDGARPALIHLDGPGLLVAATLPAFPSVAPGDRILVPGPVRPPPDDDGYGAYLRRIGAAGTMAVRRVEVVAERSGIGGALETARRSAADALARAIPEPEAGLAAGIVVGLRDRVGRDLARDFATVGASHVVAISGWNIAIVASTLGALAGRLARRRRVALIVVAIVLYTAFVGPSPSVVRAAVMAMVALVARELGRPSRAAAAMGWAVTLLLLVDPAMVDDVGFRLSVLATAGLLAWATPLAARLAGPAPGRLRGWLAESLGVSLAAQAATLPIVLAEFGRLSIVAPVVNLAVVPLVAPAMGAAGLALVAGLAVAAGMPPLAAAIGGLPAWALLGWIVGAVRLGAALPFASVALGDPWGSIAAIAAGGALVVMPAVIGHLRRRRRGGSSARARIGVAGREPARRRSGGASPRQAARAAAISLGASVVVLGVGIAYRPDGVARVVALDVGQGDAILVVGGRGGTLLVDGGPDPARLLTALDEELPPWDRTVDTVVLTHPHEDHVAGLVALLEAGRVGRVFEPGMPGKGPGYAAWEAALAKHPVPHATLGRGAALLVDEVPVSILWPDPKSVPSVASDDGRETNDVSVVLLGRAGGHRFLLMGDAEDDVDPLLLDAGLPQVDLLKVAHHGSRTASSAAFLEAVRPRIALISVGTGNDYGHPAPATLDRLGAVGAETYRTDRDGTIEVRLAAGPLRATTSGARRAARVGGGPVRGADEGLLYHRADDHPDPRGSGVAAPVPRSSRLAPGAFARRRRDRGLARPTRGRAREPRGQAPRRGGRAPPRRRQAAARDRRRGVPPPRVRERRLAPPARSWRARRGRRVAPGRPARRRRLGGPRVRAGGARDSDRRLRRQAGRPTARERRSPLRRVGTALPGRVAT